MVLEIVRLMKNLQSTAFLHETLWEALQKRMLWEPFCRSFRLFVSSILRFHSDLFVHVQETRSKICQCCTVVPILVPAPGVPKNYKIGFLILLTSGAQIAPQDFLRHLGP